jgi:Tol biopolymer transport system component
MVARLTPLATVAAIGLTAIASVSGATSERTAAIYSIRPDGTGRALVLHLEPPKQFVARSPGGRKIAYVEDGAFYVSDVSGANPVRIHAATGTLSFSPDGTRLAITTYSECGWRCLHTMLYVVNTDDTGLRLLADGGQRPSWSPDSTRLAYSSAFEIHVAGLRGGDVIVARGTNPDWAPRGDRIAYLGSRRGYAVPCFVDADGSHGVCLHGFSAVNGIVWSNDGRRLAFMQASPSRLGVVGADGRGLRRFPIMKLRGRPLAWSPDGRWLAYSKGLGEKQIYVRPVDRIHGEHRVTDEHDQPYYGDVRWRRGRISYVIYDEA